MIADKCFTEEWLDYFKKQAKHSRIDKIILEKMIYALHLLERLSSLGLKFVFKGGTSLVLLLEEGNRFSIDIDIICNVKREELEAILEKVVESSKFKKFELDEHRSYKKGVPKAHYVFTFDTCIKSSYPSKILLDILIEDSIYPELAEQPIKTKWIEATVETNVTLPTINSIAGDKLTAFAPNTIGIPYFKGEQPFSMEICKQLYDLGKLFNHIDNIKVVFDSFNAFATQEIKYRKEIDGSEDLTPEKVLRDTIETCTIIAKRENAKGEEKENFEQLNKGIRAFGTGYLMEGYFRIDDAVIAAAKVAYLSAKILTGDLSPIQFYTNQEIKDLNIEEQEWIFLNRLKKQADKSGFYYWYQVVQLLKS